MTGSEMISRASFVKGGLLAGAFTVACASGPKLTLASEPDWDKETDIVVLGCGACGMVASLAAKEAGASVITVEKNSSCGGDAIYSHGVVLGNMSKMDLDLGIEVSDDEIIAEAESGWYLMEQPIEKMSRNIVANACDTLDWLVDHEVVFANPEGNLEATYSDLPIYHQVSGWGTGLLPLCDKVAEQVDELLLETRATGLVQNDEGRVVGVVCEDAQGAQIAIKANKAVILGTGGYNHNNALVSVFDQRCVGMKAHGCPTNEGDGLVMAVAAGAASMPSRAESPTSCLLDMDSVNYACFALARDGAICVGTDGKRFMLESSQLRRINTNMAIEQYVNTQKCGSDYVCFVSCDSDAVQQTIANGVTTYQADTPEELAELIGVDPTGLAEEIAHYNEMAAAGKDEDFGKEEGLLVMQEGPYYGFKITPRLCISSGGILVNTDAQVLKYRLCNEEGVALEPIEGLYAGGEIAPYSMHYGYAISSAMTHARLAVKHAMSLGN